MLPVRQQHLRPDNLPRKVRDRNSLHWTNCGLVTPLAVCVLPHGIGFQVHDAK